MNLWREFALLIQFFTTEIEQYANFTVNMRGTITTLFVPKRGILVDFLWLILEVIKCLLCEHHYYCAQNCLELLRQNGIVCGRIYGIPLFLDQTCHRLLYCQ